MTLTMTGRWQRREEEPKDGDADDDREVAEERGGA